MSDARDRRLRLLTVLTGCCVALLLLGLGGFAFEVVVEHGRPPWGALGTALGALLTGGGLVAERRRAGTSQASDHLGGV